MLIYSFYFVSLIRVLILSHPGTEFLQEVHCLYFSGTKDDNKSSFPKFEAHRDDNYLLQYTIIHLYQIQYVTLRNDFESQDPA